MDTIIDNTPIKEDNGFERSFEIIKDENINHDNQSIMMEKKTLTPEIIKHLKDHTSRNHEFSGHDDNNNLRVTIDLKGNLELFGIYLGLL